MNRFRFTHILAASVLLLAFGRPLGAGVIWLELGSGEAPAETASGTLLTDAASDDLTVVAHDLFGTFLGTAELTGLDTIQDGHLLGVIRLDGVSGQVRLRAESPLTGLVADLGIGTILGDDFAPDLDPTTHWVAVAPLVWREDVRALTVNLDGNGEVTGIVDEGYAPYTTATVTAVAHAWWEFVAWRGDVAVEHETDNPLALDMDDDRTVTAVFRLTVQDDWRLSHFGTVDVDLDDDPDLDGYSNWSEYENGTDPLDATETEIQLDLWTGWNLISFPIHPAEGTTIRDLLGDRSSGTVWEYRAWRGRYSKPGVLKGKVAYWVYATADATDVTVRGQPIADPRVLCYEGWNAIGPAWAGTAAQSSDQIFGAWSWDSGTSAYELQPLHEDLLLGVGYWLRAAADTVVEPAP